MVPVDLDRKIKTKFTLQQVECYIDQLHKIVISICLLIDALSFALVYN